MPGPLFIVHVHARVKPDCVDSFIAATLENARASLQEPGIARFDVVQATDYPSRFILVEVYRSPQAPDLHKRTPHYAVWRDRVANMMAEPRSSTKFQNCFPESEDW
jgi:autoinducer 2-degrading protein